MSVEEHVLLILPSQHFLLFLKNFCNEKNILALHDYAQKV